MHANTGILRATANMLTTLSQCVTKACSLVLSDHQQAQLTFLFEARFTAFLSDSGTFAHSWSKLRRYSSSAKAGARQMHPSCTSWSSFCRHPFMQVASHPSCCWPYSQWVI
eukprot:154011-Pelagomonas_calceolata.AAC.3